MVKDAPSLQDLLSRNSKYTKGYNPPHSVADLSEGKFTFPSVILISCIDPRIIPEEFGGFSREEFVVVRNAGGRAEPSIRDIVIITQITKVTDVVVIHHSDCGMTHLTNDGIRKNLKDAGLGDDKLDSYEFGEIKDLEQSVRDDVALLQSSPYIPSTVNVHGYVFDLLKTGALIKV